MKKNLWKDAQGNYLPSKCSTKFLDKIEMIFGCRIEREFEIRYGNEANKVRFYDGRYKDYLIELDGKWFHRTNEQKRNDKLKDVIATRHGFKILRLPLNSNKDVDVVFAQNIDKLREIFNERSEIEGIPNIIDKIFT